VKSNVVPSNDATRKKRSRRERKRERERERIERRAARFKGDGR